MPSKSEIQDIINCLVISKGDILFTHSVFVQCFLPIRNLPNKEDFYKVRHGQVSLAIEAGRLVNPDNIDEWEKREVPSGAKARLLFSYINNQAIRTKSPVINMGKSLREFMEKNGVPIGGANAKEIVRQAKNIAAANIMLGVWGEQSTNQYQTKIAKNISFWIEKNPTQGTLWQPSMTLSDDYISTLKDHKTPLDFRALVALQNNPRAMDLYCWLSYRLRTINNPVKVPYEALHPIFGRGIQELKHFKIHFKKAMMEAYKYYPEARVALEKDYIILYKSPSPIPLESSPGQSFLSIK